MNIVQERSGGKPQRRPQAKQTLAKLDKKIKNLAKKLNASNELMYLEMFNGPNNISTDVYYFNLCNYAGMAGVFGTSASDIACNKMTLKEIDLHVRIDANNEKDLIGYTIFLVSLKDDVPDTKFNNGSGVLTMVDPDDFVMFLGTGYLNPKIFTIHKQKTFHTRNYGTATTAPSANNSPFAYDFNWKIKPNKVIKNPSGNVSSLVTSLDPSKQYYLFVTNDNETIDAENPTITIHELVTVIVPN